MMIFGIFLCFYGSSALEMETSPEKLVENLKNDKKGDELARTIFGAMTEKKFLSLYDALIPVNDGPLDHLLDEAECKELLLNRFMQHDNHANDGLEEDYGTSSQQSEALKFFGGDVIVDRAILELEGPEAVRLELPNSRGNAVASPSTLLLRTPQNGTAEARRVDGRGGGTATTL